VPARAVRPAQLVTGRVGRGARRNGKVAPAGWHGLDECMARTQMVRAYAVLVASFLEPVPEDSDKELVQCLACGRPLEAPLSVAGSLRCLDCREANAVLDPRLVERWHQGGAQI
jgi:hypothetical protein